MPDDEDAWKRQGLGGILGGALVAGGGVPQQTAPQPQQASGGGAVQPNAGLPATPNPTADSAWYGQASNWARNRFGDDWATNLGQPGNLVSSRVNLLMSQQPGLDPEFDRLMGNMRSAGGSGANPWASYFGAGGGGGGGYSNMPSIPGIDPALMSQMVAGMTEGSGPGSYNPYTGPGDKGASYFSKLAELMGSQNDVSALKQSPPAMDVPWLRPLKQPGLMG